MEQKDKSNKGCGVAVGCLTFILMFVVIEIVGAASGMNTVLGLIALIALFLIGAFFTGGFDN